MRRIYTLLAAGTTALVTAFGVWLWMGTRSAAEPEPLIPHVVTTAPIEDRLIASGVVRPAMTVEVRAAASGLVEDVLVREGERVRRGQLLARLAGAMPQAALDEAEANLRQAQLEDEAMALDIDLTAVELRRRAHVRAKDLHARGLLARQELELRELELRQAERAVERSRRARQATYARVEEARAAVQRARALVEDTEVRAPFDAVVLRRHVDAGSGVSGVGQSASGGTVLMTLGDSRRSAFYARVTAADATRLQSGVPARIVVDAGAGDPATLEGAVESISTAGEIDGATRVSTFPVVVALTQVPSTWVNLPARADFVLGVETDAVVVPVGCVWNAPDGSTYAQIDTPEGPARRPVTLGAILTDRLQIRSGLERGEVVLCR